jgi:uncharacterized membrane protein YedE/YeeE
MKRLAGALGAGLLFGVGLTYSGMVDPRNVVAFLDLTGRATGRWNPNLAGVMVGAIVVHALLLRRLGWRPPGDRSLARGGLRDWRLVDRRLVLGSALFGVGWALSGFCPGPAIAALGFGAGRAAVFLAALVAGSLIADAWTGRGRDAAET